ncbi:MAG: 6-bladed beta-propeller [Salinibacter sp.]
MIAGCQTETGAPAPTYQFVRAWGETGGAPGQFRDPIGIDVAGREVFVSEAGNRRIQVFGPTGAVRRQIGPVLAGSDTLGRPMHLAATGPALYVPDYNTDRVHVLSLDGRHRRSIDGTGLDVPLDAPGGVAVDSAGRLYTADFYNHRVVRFGQDGSFDRQWGVADSMGGAANRFTYPTDVAIHPDGGFVVADAYNHRIKRYAAADSLAWTRPKAQTGADSTKGTFNVATAVATGPGGRIYVADFFNHRIQVFSAAGDVLTAFGKQGTGEGHFERPVDVAVGDDGTLYVVDFGNDRIQVFAPEL